MSEVKYFFRSQLLGADPTLQNISGKMGVAKSSPKQEWQQRALLGPGQASAASESHSTSLPEPRHPPLQGKWNKTHMARKGNKLLWQYIPTASIVLGFPVSVYINTIFISLHKYRLYTHGFMDLYNTCSISEYLVSAKHLYKIHIWKKNKVISKEYRTAYIYIKLMTSALVDGPIWDRYMARDLQQSWTWSSV